MNSDDLNATLNSMENVADESYRVASVARNSKCIIDDLDREFESATGLNGKDIPFLFAAVGLQLARIYAMNELTKIEKAGRENKKEKSLHKFQEKILKGFSGENPSQERPYYASLEHIITVLGVPYDATSSLSREAIAKITSKGHTWDYDIEALIPQIKPELGTAWRKLVGCLLR